MQFSRLALLMLTCLLLGGRSMSASSNQTNFLTFCSEADLISAFAQGGNWVMDCGTNSVLIRLNQPLVASVSNRISIFTTNNIVITGSNTTRLIVVQTNAHVTMGGFSFFSGRQTGTNENNGGIEDTAGGAVYNDGGTFEVFGGRFEANSAVGVTGTAGENGTGDHGEDGGDAAGGAIYNYYGTVSLSNVVFVSNVTTGGAGGNGGSGRTTGFGMSGGNGGNGGSAGGSAIYSEDGSVHIIACTFTNNAATGAAAGVGGAAGGLLGSPGFPGESGDGVGAAVAGKNAEIRISSSTFVVNKSTGANGLNGNTGVGRNSGGAGLVGGDAAGGAIYSIGEEPSKTNLWVLNSTFFRNSSTSGRGGNGGAGSSEGIGGYDGGQGGNGGFATGGAIDSDGRAFIQHCTLSENTISGGAGGSGGAAGGTLADAGDSGSKGSELGAAIYGSSTAGVPVFLVNSIMAVSNPSISGAIDDGGGNLSSDPNILLDSPQSLKGTNAFLRPLANNGGPTATIAILTNSLAVNRGILEFCLRVDQRGSNRLDRCDSGAYETPLPVIPPEVLGTNSFTLNRSTNHSMLLQWPAGHTNLFLEVTTNLLSTNTIWTRVTNGISYSTNRNSLLIRHTNLAPQEYFRLFGLSGHGTGGGIPPFPPFPPFSTVEASSTTNEKMDSSAGVRRESLRMNPPTFRR
jgi:hypothetical protein